MTTPPTIISEWVDYMKSIRDKFTELMDEDPQCAPTGSRVICTPPVLNTDNDRLIYCPDSIKDQAVGWILNKGATSSIQQHVYPDGIVFHLGDLNPILLTDFKKYRLWVVATHWAHKLNLQTKADRMMFFRSILDDCVIPTQYAL